jgi:hypothetical protein
VRVASQYDPTRSLAAPRRAANASSGGGRGALLHLGRPQIELGVADLLDSRLRKNVNAAMEAIEPGNRWDVATQIRGTRGGARFRGGDVMFAATGVTDGDYLRGVHYFPGGATTQSVVMRSKTRTIRLINATHYFEHKPNY